jgi:hypothetical protein
MGRGGPREPQFLEGSKIKITPSYLLELSNRDFMQVLIISRML